MGTVIFFILLAGIAIIVSFVIPGAILLVVVAVAAYEIKRRLKQRKERKSREAQKQIQEYKQRTGLCLTPWCLENCTEGNINPWCRNKLIH